jgi:hypothetical protein
MRLIASCEFLKPVVVSSDGTNEAAYITQARKEAQRTERGGELLPSPSIWRIRQGHTPASLS